MIKVRPRGFWFMIFAPLVAALLPRQRTAIADAVAATKDYNRKKKLWLRLNREMQRDARLIESQITATLARLGYVWSSRLLSPADDSTKKKRKTARVRMQYVRWREDGYWYKVFVRRRGLFKSYDMLPYRTTVLNLMSEEACRELEAATQRPVTAFHSATKGVWYIVHRSGTISLLPEHVPYRSVLDFYPIAEANEAPFIVGVGLNNQVITSSLHKQPHWLIAGGSGSGKSNATNLILSQLITFLSPSDLRLILIDPKKVELGRFISLPHLLQPVIYDFDPALEAMKFVIQEINNRMNKFLAVGLTNIMEYNKEHPECKLPRIVLLIEELAMIMSPTLVGKEGKLAQAIMIQITNTGRAAGCHLIAVSQTPKAYLMPTEVKANSARIVGRVDSMPASMVILDSGAATRLDDFPGRMIFAVDTRNQEIQCAEIKKDDVLYAVALAKGKAAGVIRYENLKVIPVSEGIIRATVDHCEGKLALRANMKAYFGERAVTVEALRTTYEEVIKKREVWVGDAKYLVSRGEDGYRLVPAHVPPPVLLLTAPAGVVVESAASPSSEIIDVEIVAAAPPVATQKKHTLNCQVCGKQFTGRAHAKTCGDACRQKLKRSKKVSDV
jgi:hypothetical protein